MALLAQRILSGLSPARFSRTRPPATETTPDRILFGPKPGHQPSPLPPVRIYLGSERHQFRAERVFLWSIEKHRDPSRTYEVYLMRDVRGFSRGFWLTGFTNYRFAIPAFCQYRGRAIYNDADQIYLTDPAKLFDADMGEAGFLSINDRDTSVMLIDCERMSQVWTAKTVRQKSRKQLEAIARQHHLWGHLDGGWNARDKEYEPHNSKVVHFTTLHTQPWRPFPQQLVYFDNPTDRLWPDLEDEANAQRFLPFNDKRPSRHWPEVHLYLTSKSNNEAWIDRLSATSSTQPAEVLHIAELMEHIPDQDVLWVLDRLLADTKQLHLTIREPLTHGRGRFRRSEAFWLEHLTLVGRWHPNTRWQLAHAAGPISRMRWHHGGPAQEGSIVWLAHRKPGHNGQAATIAQALAKKLGRDVESLPIPDTELSFVIRRLFGLRPKPDLPGDAAIVVAGGWLPTRLARAYQRRHPYLRLVLCGRKTGLAPDHGGVIVQCDHFGLPPHPNRIVTRLPLNTPPSHGTDDGRWSEWLSAPHKAACLIGGDTKSYRYHPDQIQALACELDRWHETHQLEWLLVGSRRSGSILTTLKSAMSHTPHIYTWQGNDPHNPYALAIAHAETLVVTGESESMLADALAQGKPVAIFYPPSSPSRLWDRFSDWVAKKAIRPRYNKRGSIRPQQGLQYLCARALERHWVIPPRDLNSLHQWLYEHQLAFPMGAPPVHPKAYDELDERIDSIISTLNLK